ncbi:LysR family transcriptional regulator [Ursidibacter arcticus]
MKTGETMDLNAVRLFVAVVQAGSLSKASVQLDVPIATISRQLTILEKTLGITLLNRQKSGVKPTTQGQLFYEQVHLNIDNLLHIERTLHDHKHALSGVLRVSMPIGIDSIWNVLMAFGQRYPNVAIHCQATERTVDLVADGIDVAFRMGELKTDSVIATPVAYARAVWVASPELIARLGTPTTPDDLLHYPCASFGKSGEQSIAFEWQDGKCQVPCVFVSNDNSAVVHWAKMGQAVCLMMDNTAQSLIEQGQVVQVLADYPSIRFPINALYLAHRHRSAVVKSFIEFVKEVGG